MLLWKVGDRGCNFGGKQSGRFEKEAECTKSIGKLDLGKVYDYTESSLISLCWMVFGKKMGQLSYFFGALLRLVQLYRPQHLSHMSYPLQLTSLNCEANLNSKYKCTYLADNARNGWKSRNFPTVDACAWHTQATFTSGAKMSTLAPSFMPSPCACIVRRFSICYGVNLWWFNATKKSCTYDSGWTFRIGGRYTPPSMWVFWSHFMKMLGIQQVRHPDVPFLLCGSTMRKRLRRSWMTTLRVIARRISA